MVTLSIDTKSNLWKGSSGDRLKYARDRKKHLLFETADYGRGRTK